MLRIQHIFYVCCVCVSVVAAAATTAAAVVAATAHILCMFIIYYDLLCSILCLIKYAMCVLKWPHLYDKNILIRLLRLLNEPKKIAPVSLYFHFHGLEPNILSSCVFFLSFSLSLNWKNLMIIFILTCLRYHCLVAIGIHKMMVTSQPTPSWLIRDTRAFSFPWIKLWFFGEKNNNHRTCVSIIAFFFSLTTEISFSMQCGHNMNFHISMVNFRFKAINWHGTESNDAWSLIKLFCAC